MRGKSLEYTRQESKILMGVSQRMPVYVLSDTHLSITKNKPMDIFGRRWQNHTEKIRECWEAVVTPDDYVVIPGDISWAMTLDEARSDLEFLDSLPGTKLIGRGNHDYWWNTAKKMNAYFDSCGITTLKLLYNNAYDTGDFIVCGSRGWYNDEDVSPKDSDYKKIVAREAQRMELSIAEGRKLDAEKPIVMFLHFPPVFRDYICRELVDVMHRFDITRCFFGHIHALYDIPPSFEFEGITFNIVSADYLDFKPYLVKL